jgi:competence protein ComEC
MQRPFIPLVLALMAGILTGYRFRIPDPVLWTALAVMLVLLAAAALRKRHAWIMPLALPALAVIGVLAINPYLYPETDKSHIGVFAGREKVTMVGIVLDNPRLQQPEKTEMKVAAFQVIRDGEALPVRGNVWLTVKDHPEVAYGDVIRFRTRLRLPHNFNNPGGGDIEKRYLFRETPVRGFAAGAADLVILRRGQGHPLRARLEAFRTDLKILIDGHAPSPHARIIEASILGNQKDIPRETMELFNRTGTSHIIAISGFNIGIISAFIIFLVRGAMKRSPYLMLRYDMNKIALAATAVPIVLFAYAAGAGISVVRAAVMIVVFMVALLIGRRRDMINTLAAAAFVILAVAPYSLFDVSFQLSFVAVGAILAIAPVLSRFLPAPAAEGSAGPSPWRKTLRGVLLFLIVTVSATAGTLPLIAFHFNRISTVVLPANLVVGPILGILAIPVCTAVMLAAPVSTSAAVLLIQAATLLVDISLKVTAFFAAPAWSSLSIGTPSLFEILLYYVLLYALLRFLETIRPGDKPPADLARRRRLSASAIVCCLLLFAGDGVRLYIRDTHPGNLTATFLDVGQGDAAFIRFPQGKKMMIDGGGAPGGTFDMGKHVLAPYLGRERVGKIDIVVLTHPHPDHLQGLIHILDHFRAAEFWSNGEEAQTDDYRRLKAIVAAKGIRHRIVSARTPPIAVDGVSISILNPERPATGVDRDEYDSANADSLVVRIAYGDTAYLFTADISGMEEERIVRAGGAIAANVLLVPHHGSGHASTAAFLATVRPEAAVVSCGKENVFGFPHSDAVGRIRAVGTKLYRTDIHGAITVTSDGKKCSVSTYVP